MESSTNLVVRRDHFDYEMLMVVAGYTANTLMAYQQDLRVFVSWCRDRELPLVEVRRAHIELFARSQEAAGMATIARRLSTVASFYRYCVEEELIGLSPAVNVRRPKVRPESTMTGLDRNELGLFLVEAGLSNARDHALACLVGLNGLRVSEALGADVGDMGLERGHHTLRIIRKGGKTALIPMAPRTARTVYLAVGDREDGPIFLNGGGDRMDRHHAARVVRRLAKRAGIDKNISPHSLCHTVSLLRLLMQVYHLGTSKKQPPMLTREQQ